MAPSVKDLENPVPASTPAIPSANVAKPTQEAAPRPQPVPLEVAVSVNGARTIEGSDKREPFSESTKTVLVFANGAVIRLGSNVAAGQLLFVTNEKTKKEVVCQVVKSKNYGNVTGYVELEFTEPVPGFWGVRIPADSVPVPAAPKAPVAPRPVAPTATVTPAPGAPKVVAPAPASSVPPIHPAAPAPIPVVPPAKPAVAPPAPVDNTVVRPWPEVAKPAVPQPVPVAHESKPAPVVRPVATTPPPPVTPPPHAPVNENSLSAQLASQFSALVGTELKAAPSHAVAPETTKPAAPQKADPTTEELRQQAARLQEQLSSLLFREAASDKGPAPAAVQSSNSPAPIAAAPTVVSSPVPAKPPAVVPEAMHPPVVKEVIKEAAKEVASAKPEAVVMPIRVAPVAPPVAEIKTPLVVSKAASISLPVEEVRIPSWLAPLARETETTKEALSTLQSSSTTASEEPSYKTSDELAAEGAVDSSKSESVVLGGQLLGGPESTDAETSPANPSKGLKYGLIAAGVILVAGAAWYSQQPGNFITATLFPSLIGHNSPAASAKPATKPDAVVTAPAPVVIQNSTTTSAPTSFTNTPRVATNAPANVPPVESARNPNPVATPDATKTANNAAHAAAPVEIPKKPAFGEVKLATPNVNRKTGNANNDSAPAIDAAEVPAAGDPLMGLTASNGNGPSAPLPIGGDVKAAHLLKSIPPIYPPAARSQRISGDVQLDALIDAAGNVTTVKVISGPTLLHQAAISAVKQWKYAAAQLDGKPTSMHLTVTVQFRLQ